MSKASSQPKGNKVSHFAQNAKGDDQSHSLKHQSSLQSYSHSESSKNDSHKGGLIENDSQKMNSQVMLDVMKQQEEILKKKGLKPHTPKQKRFSIDSRMSDGIDSEIGSDSDKDSDIDEQSALGSPEHLNDIDQDNHLQQLDLNAEKKASKDGDMKAELELKLQKNQSKQSKQSKKDSVKEKKKKPQKKSKKQQKQRQVYRNDDFTLTNSVGRNILHRQCLKQNAEIIQDLINQYKKLKEYEYEQQKKILIFELPEQTAEQMVSEYINQLDHFGNSPLILCCIQQFDDEANFRYECLKILLEAGADINHRNPRTLWSALHWSAHYGDFKSIELLMSYEQKLGRPTPVGSPQQQDLQKMQLYPTIKTYQCFPDQEGLYPIDLAGLNGQKEAVFILIEHLIAEIKEVEKNPDQFSLFQEDEMPYYQTELDKKFMKQQRFKYLKSPLLKSRVVYWAAYFPGEKSKNFITACLGFTQVYIMARQPHQSNMTSLHAAAKNKNAETLEILSDNIRYKYIPELQQWIEKQQLERSSKEFNFSIYNNAVLTMIPQENNIYKQSFLKVIKNFAEWENEFILTHRKYKQNPSKYTFIDQKDLYGNTALHLASINGFEEGVQKLLDNGADMEIGNKEGWRPRELVQHQNIRQLYQNALEKNQGLSEQLKAMKVQLEKTLKNYNNVDDDQLNYAAKRREKDLYAFGTKLFLPDFVIVFSIGSNPKLAESNLNRMNFQIGVLRKSKFNVYLLESVYADRFYLLIGMPEKYLQQACKENKWVEDTKWYWPQPLNQLDDYLLEDKNQNFTSVTLLRQYFGEKIAFFFGWKSFITCFMILIAIPGLALQLYIIADGSEDYNNILISFWVLYVMIWSTIIVEFWKRKTSEINYRWGTLDQMNNPDLLNKTVREDFIGDECISAVTGGLTKYQKKSRTILKFLVSIPILFALMGLVVYIFLKIDEFKKSFTTGSQNDANNNLYKSLAGILQGVGIQVLNFIYTYLARYFAIKENHKYEFQYERSIIYKLMAFKVLNSYFALFYIGFVQQESNFSTLFFMLLPIMLIKQINYTIMNVWLPIFLYDRAEKNYFNIVKKKTMEHQLHQGQLDPEKTSENEDIIEKYWNDVSKDDMKNLSRAVISLQDGDEADKTDKKDIAPSIKLIKHIDVDSIELNSLRQEFLDTVNFYADSFIDLGYITLFASAFPAGPFIGMMMNSLEIRNKLNVFMYVLKRPTCQRCAGIGDWLFIWEGFSFVSVISNIGLLYYKDEKLVDLILDRDQYTSQDLQTIKTWIYICLGIAIIFLKYMFQSLIQDKPEWIRREEENWSYQEQIQKEKDEKILQQNKKYRETEEKKKQIEISKLKKRYDDELAERDEALLDLQEDVKFYKSACPPELVQQRMNKDQQNQQQQGQQSQLGKSNLFKAKTEYQLKVFGVLRSTYIKIERELLIQRLKQLEMMNIGTIMICNECGKKLSVFECLQCDITFCKPCFDEYHTLIKRNDHAIKILNKRPDHSHEYKNYTISNKYDEQAQLLEERLQNDGTTNGNEGENGHSINNGSQVKQKEKVLSDKWRKFEYFVLPTYEKSPLYSYLNEVFNYFRSEYIDNNGIDEESENIDFKKVFKLKEKLDTKGKFVIQESRAQKMIMTMEEFCIEDKLFLNRIAFLIFKRYGQKATFKNFYSLCKILQEGFSEQKFILLLDFIDEDDSQEIDKEEIKKIFYSSFLQTSEEEKKIDAVINNLFQSSYNGIMSKLEIGKKFIYSQDQNPLLYAFLVSLLQDRKN